MVFISLSTDPTEDGTERLVPALETPVDEAFSDCQPILSLLEEEGKFSTLLRDSLLAIRMAMRLYDSLGFSFNGGKDNTVVLHLIRAACLQAVQEGLDDPLTPYQVFRRHFHLFYLHTEKQMDELCQYLLKTEKRYALNTTVYAGKDFLQCLLRYHQERKPNAVIMGMRSVDPMGRTTIFSPCTPGWPSFIRVNPILPWSFVDVWDFIKRFRIQYCRLYDHGYTSLGSAYSTRKHPMLQDGSVMRLHTWSRAQDPISSRVDGSTSYLSQESDSNASLVIDVLVERGLTLEELRSNGSDVDVDDLEGSAPAIYLPITAHERQSRMK
ncbi:FAD synthetase [Giardia muris]|uniref:FAD synthase n=1 Tax=Giardia muris TaxID=5742 RepID=A0A4Z1SSZ6_GIAMU|nr:FAD synthetase [Giardia muris]|eukprot:TNJ28115.1 FAD synthetase [Giardia muris]